ncbi:histidine-rich glycoprotein-like [Ruditapes philippinarum]|uniref:histidine-rich glycoprotein-like n=1 Tax=Ruditapes philippinarum TaxID=129788 RepID=UPI00295ABB93|nr:histidine-rich glycoprotein-like [Ruditapes philippinarum]
MPDCKPLSSHRQNPPVFTKTNMFEIIPDKHELGTGSEVTVKCAPNLKLQGESSLKCLANGEWNYTSIPVCKEINTNADISWTNTPWKVVLISVIWGVAALVVLALVIKSVAICIRKRRENKNKQRHYTYGGSYKRHGDRHVHKHHEDNDRHHTNHTGQNGHHQYNQSDHHDGFHSHHEKHGGHNHLNKSHDKIHHHSHDHGHDHSHDHSHDQGNDHGHGHDHGHGRDHSHCHGHDHGHSHGHSHGHGHDNDHGHGIHKKTHHKGSHGHEDHKDKHVHHRSIYDQASGQSEALSAYDVPMKDLR